MTQTDSYKELQEAFGAKNLNDITAQLITLYRAKDYDHLQVLAKRIEEYFPLTSDKPQKIFAHMMGIFHPDKEVFYQKQLAKAKEDTKQLTFFRFIYLLEGVDRGDIINLDDIDIDYQPEYVYDSPGGYETYAEGEIFDSEDVYYEDEEFYRSFFNIMKQMHYGNLEIDLPSYMLEDIDDLDMSNREMEDVEGIHYCKHLKSLDMSSNFLSHIEGVGELRRLEELYLSDNQIGYLDEISRNGRLKTLDVSHNQLTDIAPLLDLPALEYVNLMENDIPEEQITALKKNGVVVVY